MTELNSSVEQVPVLTGEADWSPLHMPLNTLTGKSFMDGDPSGNGIALSLFVRERDQRLFGKVWYGPEVTGPPGHAHGGSIAAVLDHAMGFVCWVGGYPVVAANISINFHISVPLRTVCTVECWVDGVDGKKVVTRGRIFDTEKPDTVYSTGDGLFIQQPLERFKGFPQPPEM